MYLVRSSAARSVCGNDCFDHAQSGHVGSNVVNTQDTSSALPEESGQRQSWPQAFRHRDRASDLCQEALSRNTQDGWMTRDLPLVRMAQQAQVVFDGFAEPDTWIECEAIGQDPGGKGVPPPFLEESRYLPDDVLIGRRDLHSARIALHVHKDKAYTGSRHQFGHRVITAQSGDIVDDGSTSRNRFLRDGSFGGIDGKYAVRRGGHDTFDHRQHPSHLLVCRNRGRARARGFPADIDHRRSFCQHGQGMIRRLPQVQERTTVGERIRCDIENAHDRSSCSQIMSEAAGSPKHA